MLHRENLAKLADYLATLPDDYAAFEMQVYLQKAHSLYGWDSLDPDVEKNYALHNGGVDKCGAVACAVGHGPSAGIYVPEEMIHGGRIRWHSYIDRFFLDGYADSDGEEPVDVAHRWMFGSNWSTFDNTPKGAALRIRYLLDGKPVPHDFGDFGPTAEHVDLYTDA